MGQTGTRRDPNEIVSVTYRLPERLRSKLQRAAKAHDTSMNSEITQRLEKSFEQADLIKHLFGSEYTIQLLTTFAFAIGLIELRTGKSWLDDVETRASVDQAVRDVLAMIKKPEEGVPATKLSKAEQLRKLAKFYEPDALGRQAAIDAVERARKDLEDRSERKKRP